MLEKLLKLTDDITICEFEHVRSSDARTLANGFNVKIQPDYKKAIDDAFNHQERFLLQDHCILLLKQERILLTKTTNSLKPLCICSIISIVYICI